MASAAIGIRIVASGSPLVAALFLVSAKAGIIPVRATSLGTKQAISRTEEMDMKNNTTAGCALSQRSILLLLLPTVFVSCCSLLANKWASCDRMSWQDWQHALGGIVTFRGDGEEERPSPAAAVFWHTMRGSGKSRCMTLAASPNCRRKMVTRSS